VLERASGRAFPEYARSEIFLPLGMEDCFIAMPPERYRAYGDRVAVTPYLEDGAWKTGPAWSTAEGAAIVRPGGNGYGPVGQLAHLYEMLRGGGARARVRLLERETVDAITTRQTTGMRDTTFGFTIDRGLGTVLNTHAVDPRFNWYGSHASPETFGHAGYFSSVAFADPRHDLVVALAFNGVREDLEHFVRSTQTVDAIYADLALHASPYAR
jgi:CubicO group peptidase (beta-lactamase class C family)